MKSKWTARVRLERTLAAKKDEIYLGLLRSVLDSSNLYDGIRNRLNGLIRSRDFGSIINLADSIGETEYSSVAMHYAMNQLAALIRKYPFSFPIPGIDPEKRAIEKFLKSERLCGRYNLIHRLERKLGRRRFSFARDVMRDWIRQVIGSSPNYEAIWKLCGFGPGASVGVSGNATHLARKFLEPSWSVTPAAYPYALAALRCQPRVWELLLTTELSPYYSVDPDLFDQRLRERVQWVSHNNITLVPKTAKVHRTIAVEPLLNSYVQKGVDEFLRQRLFRFGIDLKDQSRNQRLAREGSLDGDDAYCTIDLSSASDTISFELAKDLLPPDWFAMLNAIRSPCYKLEGKVYPYQKFVSMGNGFCFPLETLIFSSVCVAASVINHQTPDFSVYGDDIIVRKPVFQSVLHLLRNIGFRHNSDKTFFEGPFRESCGADWYLGEDVRPVTLDYELDSLSNLIKFHNLTYRSERTTTFFFGIREIIRELVPRSLRFSRPYKGQVDGAFEVPIDEFMASPFARWERKTFSWAWLELVSVSIRDDSFTGRDGYYSVLMMAALRGSDSEAPFTKRRNTRTRVREVSYAGGSSTYLPSSCDRNISPRWLFTLATGAL